MSEYTGHSFLKNPPATAQTRIRPDHDPGAQPIHPGSLPKCCPVTNLDVDVTEACNLACVYCFKSELYGQYMTLNTMKRAYDWLVAASGPARTINFNFMGGEPTLRWSAIKEFVPWARRRGRGIGKMVTFSMTSNLTLWTDELRSFVDEYGFGILMSIDGCPEVQDSQRPARNGKPMSETIAHWAKSLLRTRPGSTARSTLHPKHVSRYFDNIKYIHELGFKEITVSASEYSEWNDQCFATLESEFRRVEDYILDEHLAGRNLGVTVLNYYINKLLRYRKQSQDDRIAFMKAPCGAGKGYMMMDYTGDLWPCHRFDGADTDAKTNGSFRLGNVFVDGFNHELQRAFVEFDHGSMHKPACPKCPVNPVCGGYCPAANLAETGSIYTPHDNYCRWSNLCYQSAERLYDRFSAVSDAALDALLMSVGDCNEDGR